MNSRQINKKRLTWRTVEAVDRLILTVGAGCIPVQNGRMVRNDGRCWPCWLKRPDTELVVVAKLCYQLFLLSDNCCSMSVPVPDQDCAIDNVATNSCCPFLIGLESSGVETEPRNGCGWLPPDSDDNAVRGETKHLGFSFFRSPQNQMFTCNNKKRKSKSTQNQSWGENNTEIQASRYIQLKLFQRSTWTLYAVRLRLRRQVKTNSIAHADGVKAWHRTDQAL